MELNELASVCGRTAAASHQTAARLWGMDLIEDGPDCVTVPRQRSRLVVKGWTVFRRDLRTDEVAIVNEVRATTPVRTVLDLSRSLPLEEAVASADSALRLSLLTLDELQTTLRQAWGHHASRARAVAAMVDPRSESVLESLLAVLIHLSGLVQPRRQHVVRELDGTFVARVDFCWSEHRLVVEVDGFAFHSDRSAYRNDRNRLNALERLGWRVLRFSWEDVRGRPDYVVGTIRACLADRAA